MPRTTDPAREPGTERAVFRYLLVGLSLVILVLMAAAFLNFWSLQSIRAVLASDLERVTLVARLTSEMQRHLTLVSGLLHEVAQAREETRAEDLLLGLDEFESSVHELVVAARPTTRALQWRSFGEKAYLFSEEARRILRASNPDTQRLFRLHDDLIVQATPLIEHNYLRAMATKSRIDRLAGDLENRSLWLFALGGSLALVFAFLTIRSTTRLVGQMRAQARELNRVSWQLIHNQETTARQLSHELHDELGQSLTAIKASLKLLAREHPATAQGGRIPDCVELIDEAIGNTRKISQLLRPTVLDDFGLDAGLHWLAERFTQRTNIPVDYHSSFTRRLEEQTETHLFRIAQEALTNVARHAGATNVAMQLWLDGGDVHLSIRDNGVGYSSATRQPRSGLGVNGMHARARSLGGDLTIERLAAGGSAVSVRIPLNGELHGSKDTNPARG